MPDLGTVITAIVTPFTASGDVDEETFTSLLGFLAEQGSDGVVVCGTTGEAATLDDEEHLRVIELAVQERPHPSFSVIAGVGSNDTRHATKLTQAACERGADALLSVNPYYNRPNRRGVLAHYREVVAAADRPIVLYNIPSRTGSDLPNELLAELAQLDHIEAVKQANNDNLALVDGLELYAGNDEVFARTLELGGKGGILTATHVAGPLFRRIADEPDAREELDQQLAPLLTAMGQAPAATTCKAALGLLGHPAGSPRLPYVDITQEELDRIRTELTKLGILEQAAR